MKAVHESPNVTCGTSRPTALLAERRAHYHAGADVAGNSAHTPTRSGRAARERLRFSLAVSPVRIRSQLSLFVPPETRPDLEAIRRVVDPVQHARIPAHVTLCREDELEGVGLSDLHDRLARARAHALTLEFGPPERFAEHGILLPCIRGTDAFQLLRTIVLDDRHARAHAPHLTLAHPRNPKAPGNDLGSTALLRMGLRITFTMVHLIEQVNEDPWVVRGTASLQAPPDNAVSLARDEQPGR